LSAPRRALVVGASSGIGRGVALALARSGARVVAVARRADRLAELAEAGGGRIFPLAGDVRGEEACASMVAAALAELGGLDDLVYAAGVSDMALVTDTGHGEWRRILETNVIGAGRVFAHAAAELTANRGQFLVMSSLSEARPKPGLVAYAASKAALRKLIEGVRSENPEVACTIVSIGPTAGTEFGRAFEPAVAETLKAKWVAGGFLAPGQMTIDDVAARIVECLEAPMRTDDLVLAPRP
jgi:NAD(P)-dependent dehydrogenase (short-subunit alcohol dehydrogenase family)